jgi:hypothetical protein
MVDQALPASYSPADKYKKQTAGVKKAAPKRKPQNPNPTKILDLEAQAKASGDQIEALMLHIERIEACLCKIATMTGQANNLEEFGMTRWQPGLNDMKKFKDPNKR